MIIEHQSPLRKYSGKGVFLFVGVIFLMGFGCRYPPPLPQDLFAQQHSSVLGPEYDSPGSLKTSNLLPADILKGEHYTVKDQAMTNGLMTRFTIDSSFGQFTVNEEDLLRIRIKEINALAELKKISKTNAFGEGIKQTLLSPVTFFKNLFKKPETTMEGIPQGFQQEMTQISDMMDHDRSHLDDSKGREFIGFSKLKRQLAYTLGVDVYSSNQILQDELDRVAWSSYAGGMGMNLALLPIPGAGLILMGMSFSNSMNSLFRDKTPEELGRINKEKLKQLGLGKDLITQFLTNPWYSPRHETILVEALTQMRGVRDRGQFLRIAIGAKAEEEALFFQRLAEMMADFHRHVVPLAAIVVVPKPWLVAYSTDRALVAFLPWTFLRWTPSVEAATDRVTGWTSTRYPTKRVELWITGTLTSKARIQLENRGVMIHEHATIQRKRLYD